MHVIGRALLCCLLFASLATPALAQFTITDLGTLGGSSSTATAINTRGDVVGFASNALGADRAFLVPAGGAITDLGTLGGPSSYAYGINSFGLVVGSAATGTTGNPQRAFVWNGTMQPLGSLGGPTSTAYAINDIDDIVGTSDTSPTFGNPHGFRWRQGVIDDIGTLGGQFSVAFGVNDANVVVGSGFLPGNAANHAIRWTSGAPQDLGVIAGTHSVATAINAAGAIVGYSDVAPPTTVVNAFLRAAGSSALAGLGTFGGANSQALAINDAGLVVGWAELLNTQRRAFSSTGSGLTDLNTLLPGGSGWVLQEARGVNNAGQIVGVGLHDGATRAFLLSPATITTGVAGGSATAFAGAFPNPVRDRTQFALSLAAEGHARLGVYDVSGRLVRTLFQGRLGAGRYTVTWDGRGDAGEALAPGLYLARFEHGSGPAVTRRVSLVR